jgi:integrase
MPLKLVRRPKSPNWVIRGTLRGIRVEESTGTDDKRYAEEIRAKREGEILKVSIYGRAVTASFAEAALSYIENGGSRRFLEAVIRHFGTMPLVKIDQDTIEMGASKIYPTGSAATKNRQFFTPTLAVMRHAAQRGLCTCPIVTRPKLKPGRVRWLTLEEAERLIAACSKHLRPLVIFMLYTGARVGEALWLDWRCVDLQRRHVTFTKTKNGEARGVPLNNRVVAALANLTNRDGEVFRRPDGLPYQHLKHADDVSAGTRIKTAFKAACRRAKIEDFHPHDCRHTWASWHYAENRDFTALMALGGWKSIAMVMRYAHANVDQHRHTIDRLPGGKAGGTQMGKQKKI